jgi:hypothetical protein
MASLGLRQVRRAPGAQWRPRRPGSCSQPLRRTGLSRQLHASCPTGRPRLANVATIRTWTTRARSIIATARGGTGAGAWRRCYVLVSINARDPARRASLQRHRDHARRRHRHVGRPHGAVRACGGALGCRCLERGRRDGQASPGPRRARSRWAAAATSPPATTLSTMRARRRANGSRCSGSRSRRREVAEVLAAYGVTEEEAAPLVAALKRKPGAWVDFMMRFELGLERPDPRRALQSAATMAIVYVAGGLLPLSPNIRQRADGRASVSRSASRSSRWLCSGM